MSIKVIDASPPAAPINLVLADAQPVFLAGLKQLLAAEPDMTVVASCTSSAETLASVRQLQPDVLVTELHLNGTDGLSVVRQMRAQKLPGRVVFLTSELTSDEVIDIMRLGAEGVVLKDMAPELLTRCIRKVHAGGKWMETQSVASALDKILAREAAAQEVSARVSRRELAVIRMVVTGLRNKEIANALGITEGTVKVHLHSIYQKLQLRGRAALAAYAQRKGLV